MNCGMDTPKLVITLKAYSWKQFGTDLTAGVIVGVVTLPLAIAFAIASGLSPEKGLFTAIVAGFIISAFGGSRVQIDGPTGAFIVIVYSIVQEYGVDGLTIATFIAGIILMLMGFARMGSVTIPENILRVVVFSLPLSMPLSIQSTTQRRGITLYVMNIGLFIFMDMSTLLPGMDME